MLSWGTDQFTGEALVLRKYALTPLRLADAKLAIYTAGRVL